jgi:hypothetical protein
MMDVQELFMEFFRPVALGTVAVLAVIVLLGLRMPSRAKVSSRPPRQN